MALEPRFRYVKRIDGGISLFLEPGATLGKDGSLVYLGWDKVHEAEVAKGNFDLLQFEKGDWGTYDFLIPFKSNITNLAFSDQRAADFSSIESLTNLESLCLPSKPKTPFSFAKLTKLKSCSIFWDKKYSNDLFELSELKKISIRGFGEENLKSLWPAKNLEKLYLTWSPKLTSLDGIGSLESLLSLDLYRNTKLVGIKELSNLRELRELYIESCNGITDFAPISDLVSLERLSLQLKELHSLSFIQGIEKLKKLNFGKTKILDGNLVYIDNLSSLDGAYFTDQKHYSHKYQYFEAKYA